MKEENAAAPMTSKRCGVFERRISVPTKIGWEENVSKRKHYPNTNTSPASCKFTSNMP
jgi:hypothetical protein